MASRSSHRPVGVLQVGTLASCWRAAKTRELILSPADLDDALNFRGVPSFSADALHGTGVFETLKALSKQVLQRLAKQEQI